MSPDQYNKVLSFIQQHHRFGYISSDGRSEETKQKYPNLPEYGFMIKYIDNCYDTRFGDVWSISFRGMGNNINFRSNSGPEVPYDNLYDWVMGYLGGDWVPTKEQALEMKIN